MTAQAQNVQLPDGWDVRRLKFMASCNDEALPETTDPALEIDYVDISSVELGVGIKSVDRLPFDEAPSRARRIARDGDTIVSTVRTYLKAIAAIRDPSPDLVVSTGFAVLRPMQDLDGRFLAYALQASSFVDAVVANSMGVSYPAINPSELVCLPILFPHDKGTQGRIADFLDWKTGQIDALIAKKRALIEKLKEKRLAGITRAVTKGLDPKAPLRDSGVPWIGQIPDSWDSANLRRFAVMKTGHTPSRSEPSYWQDCDIPWFGLADVWQLRDGTRTYLGETKEQISALGLANSAAELLPAGTVVFSRTASVGFSGIMPVPMATTQDFWNWVPEERLLPEYLLFLFRAMSQEFDRLTMGSTHKTIYQPDAASLRVCVPSLPEQRAIVAHIIKMTKVIDEMAAKVELAIVRLVEYRSALITAAVTGKLDIYKFAIPATA